MDARASFGPGTPTSLRGMRGADGVGDKRYYTLVEFARILGITPNAVRYWGDVFLEMRGRRRGGRYYFVPAQIELGLQIRELVNERGMTLRGAHRAIYSVRDRRRVQRHVAEPAKVRASPAPVAPQDLAAFLRAELLAVARILSDAR